MRITLPQNVITSKTFGGFAVLWHEIGEFWSQLLFEHDIDSTHEKKIFFFRRGWHLKKKKSKGSQHNAKTLKFPNEALKGWKALVPCYLIFASGLLGAERVKLRWASTLSRALHTPTRERGTVGNSYETHKCNHEIQTCRKSYPRINGHTHGSGLFR